MFISKKKFTALTVLLILTSVVGVAGGITQYFRAQKYRMAITHGYTRSMAELTDSVKDIEFSLEKGLLISSPAQMVRLSNEINRNSNSAMANLGQLPLSDNQLDKTEKFLTQAGDFTNSLAMKLSMGQSLTAEDYANLKKLADYSGKLATNFQKMQKSMLGGTLNFERLKNEMKKKGSNYLGDMISAQEEDFVNYPALVYDGPFSSHIDTVEFSALKNLPEVDVSRARENLRSFIGNDKFIITEKGEKGGNLPCYTFEVHSDNHKARNYLTAEITKQGGKLAWFLNNHNPTDSKISVSQAISNAKNFLVGHGYYNMTESYYDCSNNVATINFAYEQNGIVMYPDLIKVKIAMDSGECIGMEAGGFLLNNKDRSEYTPKITEEDAKSSISSLATIDNVRLAVIPTDYMTEILCYELKGHIDDKNYLVYVNAETGVQEKVMILLETENGILTI